MTVLDVLTIIIVLALVAAGAVIIVAHLRRGGSGLVYHQDMSDAKNSEGGAGDNLPWKLAMWGSHRDAKFVKSLAKRFPTLGAVENERGWFISEGPQLRHKRSREPVEPVAELEGKPELNSKTLRRLEERLYSFPPRALSDVSSERAYVRKGRAKSVEGRVVWDGSAFRCRCGARYQAKLLQQPTDPPRPIFSLRPATRARKITVDKS